MASAADIIVNLVAKTARFEKGFSRSSKSVKSFRNSTLQLQRTIGRAVGSLGIFGGALSGVGFAALTKQAIDANDELAKMATRLGLTAEKLKEMQIAAELSGNTVRNLNLGIQRMTRRVNEAASGTGEAQAALHELGLDAKALAALSPDQIFQKVANAMDDVSGRGKQIQLAFKLFDSEGVGLLTTLNKINDEGFQGIIQNAREMNAVLDDFETGRFEVAKDQITLMNLAMDGLRNTTTQAVLPAFVLMADVMTGISKNAATIADENAESASNMVKWLAATVAVGKLFLALGGVLVAIGLRLLQFVLKPLELIEKQARTIINLGGLINAVPSNTFFESMAEQTGEAIDNLDKFVEGFDGVGAEMAGFIAAWEKANARIREGATAAAEQRAAQAEFASELEAQLERQKVLQAAITEQKKRQSQLDSIVASTRTQDELIIERIRLLNDAILKGEGDINKLIEARSRILAGIGEKEKDISGIISATRTQQERDIEKIRKLNEFILKGEGDINAAIEARTRILKGIAEDSEEQFNVLTEFGSQAARNLQDSFADFFKNMKGGFKGILQSFVKLLRDMVAQLLARKVLLSFFGALSKTGGGLGSFAGAILKGITKRHQGGPLAAGQVSLVRPDEEFFIPKTPGTVVPNNKAGRGGSNVTIVNHNNFTNADSGLIRQMPALLEQQGQLIMAQVRANIAEGRM